MSVYDDVPRTFQDMYVDPKWVQAFAEWADQRTDWIAPLTRALFAMGSWDRTPESARVIYGELLAATPPMDAQVVAALDPDGQQQLPTDFFDEADEELSEALSLDSLSEQAVRASGSMAAAATATATRRRRVCMKIPQRSEL